VETVGHQLVNLDATIRASIAKYAPQTSFSSTPADHPTNGCNNPFARSIGRQDISDPFATPAPTTQQCRQITVELAPAFAAVGFHPNDAIPGQPPRPLTADNDSHIRDDGALINLVNHHETLITYDYDTGCHLLSAWRTAPPPLDMRPPNDPNVHYPYLYGPPAAETSTSGDAEWGRIFHGDPLQPRQPQQRGLPIRHAAPRPAAVDPATKTARRPRVYCTRCVDSR
jgi:Lipoprotein confined to pathogenic Mycobacterium